MRTWGLMLGPAAFAATLASPTGLEPEAHRLAATALLGPALAVVLGVADAQETFAAFGHPILFVFIGSFLVARAMATHGLDRRIALFVLCGRVSGTAPCASSSPSAPSPRSSRCGCRTPRLRR